MRPYVLVAMRNGDTHRAAGWASEVMEKIAEAAKKDGFATLEVDTIPTGQMFYVNPAEVSSVKDIR